jgi:predicted ATPase
MGVLSASTLVSVLEKAETDLKRSETAATLAGTVPSKGALPMSTCSHFGRFEIRFDERQVRLDGHPAALGARAFDLLAALVAHRDRVVPKAELMDIVWPGLVVEENNLQVQVSALRKLLGVQAIATVPGRGYRWTLTPDGDLPPPQPVPPVHKLSPLAPSTAAAPALFGRDAELHALTERLRGHRLVTLIGPGGVGKTRLAEAALSTLRSRFAGGTVLVELAPLADPGRVADALAGALGITLQGPAPVEALATALVGRTVLVMLDNAEHQVDAVGDLLAALLPQAPTVHWLVTSQQRLRVAGEALFRLGPLPLPSTPSPSHDEAAASDAVQLFVARVRALQPAFALTPENSADITEVCRLLDGLPLALELGAARVPLLGVAGVRRQLDHGLRLLRGGARGAPARHQSLGAAMAWSHGLLEGPAQQVFRCLGVFVGGFTLDMAQAVVATAALDALDVVDHLGTLVDHSLVEVGAGEAPRYRLLETMRAFALEQLALAGETDSLRQQHALAVEDFFRRTEDATLAGRCSRRRALAALAPELDNLRAALTWALAAPGETALAARLAGYGHALMYGTGRSMEWFERIQPLSTRLDESVPALTRGLGWMALAISGYHAGWPAAQRLHALTHAAQGFRACGDALRLYGALGVQMLVAGQCRDAALVAALDAELAALSTPDWPPVGLRSGVAYHRATALAQCGRFDEALAAYVHALPLVEAADDDRRVFQVLIDRGWVLRELGQLDQAVQHFRALLERGAREGYDEQRLAAIRSQLAATLARRGEADAALYEARLALPVLKVTLGWHLWGNDWIPLAVGCGQHEAAMQLLGHFQARSDRNNFDERRQMRLASESACGAVQVANWVLAGEALDADAALRLCEQVVAQPAPAPSGPRVGT